MHQSAEALIRSKLERSLGPLLDAVWEELVEDRFVEMYLGGTLEIDDLEAGWEVLKKAAQKRMRLVHRGASELCGENECDEGPRGREWRWAAHKTLPGKHEKDEGLVEAFFDHSLFFGPRSKAMLRATSEYFGRLANQHPEVVRFRDEVLGGGILSPEKARKLMGSYAARFFSLEWFSGWGIPVVGHASEIVGEYDWGSPHEDRIDHRVTVRVDPPGITERVRYAPPDAPLLDENQVATRCVLRSGEALPPYKVGLSEDPEETGNYETPSRPMAVWPGSVVSDLYVLAGELAEAFWPGIDAGPADTFRCWRKHAAAEFVLTGVAPLTRPLEARLYKGSGYPNPRRWVKLNVSPWVLAEEVSRAYRRVQGQVFDGRNRLPDPKTLDVTRFVWEQERLNGHNRPSWPVLCERWNKEHSEQQFEEWRHLRTYFERGEKAVKGLNFSGSEAVEEGYPDG